MLLPFSQVEGRHRKVIVHPLFVRLPDCSRRLNYRQTGHDGFPGLPPRRTDGCPTVDRASAMDAPSFRSFISEGWETTDLNLRFSVPRVHALPEVLATLPQAHFSVRQGLVITCSELRNMAAFGSMSGLPWKQQLTFVGENPSNR